MNRNFKQGVDLERSRRMRDTVSTELRNAKKEEVLKKHRGKPLVDFQEGASHGNNNNNNNNNNGNTQQQQTNIFNSLVENLAPQIMPTAEDIAEMKVLCGMITANFPYNEFVQRSLVSGDTLEKIKGPIERLRKLMCLNGRTSLNLPLIAQQGILDLLLKAVQLNSVNGNLEIVLSVIDIFQTLSMGKQEEAIAVANANAIPIFITLGFFDLTAFRENIFSTLSNFCIDCPFFAESLIKNNILTTLVEQLQYPSLSINLKITVFKLILTLVREIKPDGLDEAFLKVVACASLDTGIPDADARVKLFAIKTLNTIMAWDNPIVRRMCISDEETNFQIITNLFVPQRGDTVETWTCRYEAMHYAGLMIEESLEERFDDNGERIMTYAERLIFFGIVGKLGILVKYLSTDIKMILATLRLLRKVVLSSADALQSVIDFALLSTLDEKFKVSKADLKSSKLEQQMAVVGANAHLRFEMAKLVSDCVFRATDLQISTLLTMNILKHIVCNVDAFDTEVQLFVLDSVSHLMAWGKAFSDMQQPDVNIKTATDNELAQKLIYERLCMLSNTKLGAPINHNVVEKLLLDVPSSDLVARLERALEKFNASRTRTRMSSESASSSENATAARTCMRLLEDLGVYGYDDDYAMDEEKKDSNKNDEDDSMGQAEVFQFGTTDSVSAQMALAALAQHTKMFMSVNKTENEEADKMDD